MSSLIIPSVQPMNPEWIATANKFISRDMQPHPSTQKVFKLFTQDAKFGQTINGIFICVTKDIAEDVYKVCCENDVEAMGSTINELAQTVFGEEGYLTWKFSGPQYRLGHGVGRPTGWYQVTGESQLYFRKEGDKTLICKYITVSNNFTPLS